MTSLWRIESSGLIPIDSGKLDAESQIEDWIERDPSLLDPNLLIIGRQVKTEHSGPIDLLALDSDGTVSIIELKRNKTPRDVIAQVLDYASWIVTRETADIYEIANRYFQSKNLGNLPDVFRKKFERPIPELLNSAHTMLVVASELDASSERIVEYLSEAHGVPINTAFFKVFVDGDRRYLSADWLIDEAVAETRVEKGKRRQRAPWKGDWYILFDEGHSWEDMTKYKFFSAGGGRVYTRPLEKLSVGDPVYAYRRRAGYVGFGIVTAPSVQARDFKVNGQSLLDLPLSNPDEIKRNADDPERAEYAVAMEWKKVVSINEAKRYPGIFSSALIVCQLTEPASLEFLYKEFGKADTDNQTTAGP
jgi:hypothetical protein